MSGCTSNSFHFCDSSKRRKFINDNKKCLQQQTVHMNFKWSFVCWKGAREAFVKLGKLQWKVFFSFFLFKLKQIKKLTEELFPTLIYARNFQRLNVTFRSRWKFNIIEPKRFTITSLTLFCIYLTFIKKKKWKKKNKCVNFRKKSKKKEKNRKCWKNVKTILVFHFVSI